MAVAPPSSTSCPILLPDITFSSTVSVNASRDGTPTSGLWSSILI